MHGPYVIRAPDEPTDGLQNIEQSTKYDICKVNAQPDTPILDLYYLELYAVARYSTRIRLSRLGPDPPATARHRIIPLFTLQPESRCALSVPTCFFPPPFGKKDLSL